MYLMYVDESGDSGANTASSRYYILSGLVVHENTWRSVLDRLVGFRRRMKGLFKLRQRDEIHTAIFINGRLKANHGLPRQNRLAILRALISELSQMPDIRLINVVVDKQGRSKETDVFELAWKALIQRFENTIQHKNFPGSNNPSDLGVILPDDGNTDKLRHLLRKMRAFNRIPNSGNRNLPLRFIVEDPVHRNSQHSYFIQCVDVTAYFLQQYMDPNKFIRKNGARNYFLRLANVVNKHASPKDPMGIVRL